MAGNALAAKEGDPLMFLMSHASWKVIMRGENMIRLPQAVQSFHKDKILKIFLWVSRKSPQEACLLAGTMQKQGDRR